MMEIFSRNKMLRGSISTAEVPDNIRFFQSNASSEETEDRASDRKNGEWLRVQLVSEVTLRKIKFLPKLFSKPIFFSGTVLTLIWLLFMLIIYNPAILDPRFQRSGYNAVWCEGETREWLMTVEKGLVTA